MVYIVGGHVWEDIGTEYTGAQVMLPQNMVPACIE